MRKLGFTLIEVLVVVAIVGVLLTIAYPNYAHYVRRAKRERIKAQLVQGLVIASEYRVTHGTVQGFSARVLQGIGSGLPYQLSVSVLSKDNLQLIASPIGLQKKDECGKLTITLQGEKLASQAGCWS